jgi:hypothetical protein
MHKQSKPLQNVWIKKTHLVSYGGPDICHFWILMPPFLGCSHRIYLKSSQIMIYSISGPYLQKGFNLCNIPHTCSHLESELQKFPNSRYKLGQASVRWWRSTFLKQHISTPRKYAQHSPIWSQQGFEFIQVLYWDTNMATQAVKCSYLVPRFASKNFCAAIALNLHIFC